MKRLYFFLARTMVVLIILITALFTVRVIQTVQAESRFSGGSTSGSADLNAAYPVSYPLEVHITGTGSGTEIVISSPEGVDCGAICTGNFAKDSTVKLVAGADSPDVVFVQWVIDGELGPTSSLLTLKMDKPKIVFAIFNNKSNPYNYLTVSRVGSSTAKVTGAPAGVTAAIDCGVNCGALYENGKAVTLTAVPGAGEMLVKWVVNGVDESYDTTLNLTMDNNQNVLAVFGPFKYRLFVNKAGNGTVTSDVPGVNCGITCLNVLYAPGTVVKLTATPGTGAKFLNWDLGSGPVTTNPITITMNSDKTVGALFTGSAGNMAVTLTGAKNPSALQFDYTITVTNKGPDGIIGGKVTDSTANGENVSWTCTGSGGATCAASGVGALNDTVSIPVKGVVTYKVHRKWFLGTYTYTVTAAPPLGTGENDPSDNSKSLNGTFIDMPTVSK